MILHEDQTPSAVPSVRERCAPAVSRRTEPPAWEVMCAKNAVLQNPILSFQRWSWPEFCWAWVSCSTSC